MYAVRSVIWRRLTWRFSTPQTPFINTANRPRPPTTGWPRLAAGLWPFISQCLVLRHLACSAQDRAGILPFLIHLNDVDQPSCFRDIVLFCDPKMCISFVSSVLFAALLSHLQRPQGRIWKATTTELRWVCLLAFKFLSLWKGWNSGPNFLTTVLVEFRSTRTTPFHENSLQ